MKYDFIIIGCGISALYLLYLLRNQNLKVCILEKNRTLVVASNL